MIARTTALLLAVGLVGCQWGGRPDGSEANHSPSHGIYDTEGQATPLGGTEITEPLDPADFGTARGTTDPVPALETETQ